MAEQDGRYWATGFWSPRYWPPTYWSLTVYRMDGAYFAAGFWNPAYWAPNFWALAAQASATLDATELVDAAFLDGRSGAAIVPASPGGGGSGGAGAFNRRPLRTPRAPPPTPLPALLAVCWVTEPRDGCAIRVEFDWLDDDEAFLLLSAVA